MLLARSPQPPFLPLIFGPYAELRLPFPPIFFPLTCGFFSQFPPPNFEYQVRVFFFFFFFFFIKCFSSSLHRLPPSQGFQEGLHCSFASFWASCLVTAFLSCSPFGFVPGLSHPLVLQAGRGPPFQLWKRRGPSNRPTLSI